MIACAGQYTVQEGGGGGGTPTPTSSPTGTPFPAASKPGQASFNTDIQPILDKGTCGRSGCHDLTTKSGGMGLSTQPVVATASAVQMSNNLAAIACISPLTTFQPPDGVFLSYFCTNSTTANGTTDHVPGKVQVIDAPTGADCTKMYAWVSSGGTGTPAPCP